MAERDDPEESFSEESAHKLALWEEFLVRAVEAGNKAISYLELEDTDIESMSDDELEDEYSKRWAGAGEIVVEAYNFLWPEIEALAMKLGVPFLPEIEALMEDEDD